MKKLFRTGEPFIWLTGGALAFSLLLVVGLILLILINGMGFFWPRDVVRFTLTENREVIGEVDDREVIPDPDGTGEAARRYRLKVKQGNRDLYGADFLWFEEEAILRREVPERIVIIERKEWGNLYGTLQAVRDGGQEIASGPEASWKALLALLPTVRKTDAEIHHLEKKVIGDINYGQEKRRLQLADLANQGVTGGPEVERLQEEMADLQARYDVQAEALGALRTRLTAHVTVAAAGGLTKQLPVSQVVRAYQPNRMGPLAKSGHYLAKVWEFVADDPRESNTEGGVFPAIFGTVLMVFIMSLMVTPLGVVAAFYLREYAKQGPFVSAVRIAVNNLAGVPSIVFGVFGVGFFIYFVGGTIDRLFYSEALPTPTFGTGGILWASLTLALLTVPVVIVATEEGLAAIPRGIREASLALGATKFETTWRVVLPSVMPSILTGVILAIARAAGEVAPLMITGVVKLAPALPIDGHCPFLHLDRKFMHLGFHIYDVGFQSPHLDAARPMVYTTTLLLLLIVLVLNLAAIQIRNHLKKKFAGSAV